MTSKIYEFEPNSLLFDSNFFIDLFNGFVTQEGKEAIKYFNTGIPSICVAELMVGISNNKNMNKNEDIKNLINSLPSIPFSNAAAEEYANIYNYLRKNKIILENSDILIASIALSMNSVLVTHNTKHFSKIPGLKIIDFHINKST